MRDSDKIRELNDAFRRTLEGGRVLISQGVRALGHYPMGEAAVLTQTFTAFTPDNDPHGEHDFGSFALGDDVVFWKIDTYDSDLTMMSPDPSDPNVTVRVLTIMLAEEYGVFV